MTRISQIMALGLPVVLAAFLATRPIADAQVPQQQMPPAAQQAAPQAVPVRPLTAAELAQQLADTQEQLARQTRIAENARLEVEKVRAEMKLKEELLALGIQRNAELYAVGQEIAESGLSQRSLEPFVQGHRVKMENLRQDYEDRLRAARIYPETLPPSVQTQMETDLAAEKAAAN